MGTCQSGSCGTSETCGKPEDQDAALRKNLNRIKNKLLVMSGKGGVGKTSVSVNLAMSLAEKGFMVGLMDVDIHGPDVPRMLGLTGMAQATPEKKLLPMRYSKNLGVISIESLMPDKDDAVIWRGPMKHNVIRQFIGDVAWGDLDYLIIDSPPGTGDEPMTVAQTIPDAKAVIVTTPQEVSLADVRKSISFCRAVSMDVLGIIENMSGLICPHCKELIPLFGSGGGERTAREAGLDFLGRIPFDPNVVSCGDTGVSLMKSHQASDAASAFGSVADTVADKVEKRNKAAEAEPAGINGNRFAIPLADGKLTPHFGHCKEFAIIEVNDGKIKSKTLMEPPPHEPGVLPQWIQKQGVGTVIAGGMGQRAVGLMQQYGISVVTGAPADDPETLVLNYLSGNLATGDNVCDH